ncbi:MAG: VWA domain-containing protein [Bdellovibrionia bacterium]
MFRFESREYFQFLWLLPLILAGGYYYYRRTLGKLAASIGPQLTPFLTSSVSLKKRRAKWALEILAVLFFAIALARPQLGTSLQEVKSEGVEIVIAVDVSNSMLTEDVKPSRIELAKGELKRLVDRLSGDKVGIVVFAGSSFLLSPLTTDHSALSMYIDSLSTDMVSLQGTVIKPALDEAVDAFKRGGADEAEDSKATRVIIIASDGEDHEEGALQLARKLTGEDIRIFTIGFGTEQGGPVPERDAQGNMRGYKNDDKGQPVLSTHKGEFMRKLAAAGQGAYFYAIGGSNQMELLKAEIDKLEKALFETQMATDYDERFQIPLTIGLILALIELLMSERRKVLATRREYESGEVV